MTVGSCEFESHLLHNKLKLIKRNFRASEWESLLSRNERSRKCRINEINAEIAQLVEHNLAKVGVASSSLVFRSLGQQLAVFFVYICFVEFSYRRKGKFSFTQWV